MTPAPWPPCARVCYGCATLPAPRSSSSITCARRLFSPNPRQGRNNIGGCDLHCDVNRTWDISQAEGFINFGWDDS